MAAKTIETLGFHAKHVRVMRCHLWFSARIEPRCQHGGSSEKLKPRTFFSRCVTVQQNDRKINFLHSYSYLSHSEAGWNKRGGRKYRKKQMHRL